MMNHKINDYEDERRMIQTSKKFAKLAVERTNILESIIAYEKEIEILKEKLYFTDRALADFYDCKAAFQQQQQQQQHTTNKKNNNYCQATTTTTTPMMSSFSVVRKHPINDSFFDIMVYSSEKNVLCHNCSQREFIFVLCKNCPYHLCLKCAKKIYKNPNCSDNERDDDDENNKDEYLSYLSHALCKGCFKKLKP